MPAVERDVPMSSIASTESVDPMALHVVPKANNSGILFATPETKEL